MAPPLLLHPLSLSLKPTTTATIFNLLPPAPTSVSRSASVAEPKLPICICYTTPLLSPLFFLSHHLLPYLPIPDGDCCTDFLLLLLTCMDFWMMILLRTS
ncbi:hypothetical protein HanPI659440_Chr10g0365591 [Helianthus annuus]|nr:hypothetical protein HanPI659440_Chr10g0365591 [Helianthus annuus]